MVIENLHESVSDRLALHPPTSIRLKPQKPQILTLLLGAVALLALTAAIYFFYKNQQLSAQLNIQPTPIPTPVENNNDGMTKWATYSDPTFPIYFNFPPLHTVNYVEPKKTVLSIYNADSFLEIFIEKHDDTLNKLIENTESYLSSLENEHPVIDGKKAEVFFGYGGEGAAYPQKLYILDLGSQRVTISASTFNNWITVDQILSTIKFL